MFSLLTRKDRTPARDARHIGSAAFKANPYPWYARMRAEGPVHRVVIPTGEIAWLIVRYDEVAQALRDERFVKNAANALTPQQAARQRWFRKVFKSMRRNMLSQDPPVHTRLRALVSKAFTPRLIEQMRQRVQALTEHLLDQAPTGQVDLIRDYALPLPTTIIAEMLGVPVADRHRFHRYSTSILTAAASTWGLVKAIPSGFALMRYIRHIVKLRRNDPQDDLVSALIRVEDGGETLSEEELSAMVMLLLIAGHETTVNLIGNGTLALLENSDQMDMLRRQPQLIDSAVEELLRFTSPVEIATDRYSREAVEIGGVTIPRGEYVYGVLASANRDERQFANADALDITRDPNRHLAFGLGAHFCLGAALARLEGQIAINTLLRRAPKLRLAVSPGALRWRPGLLLRGLQALPVNLGY